MGVCVSCIGTDRRESTGEDEEGQLLFGDANGLHYGSIGEPNAHRNEDPADVQREIEALQRVVARTSDNLVDIFEIVAPHRPTHALSATVSYPNQDARLARYQSLLAKLSTQYETPATKIEWSQQDGDGGRDKDSTVVPVKSEADDYLVGDFADAAAAMK